VFLHAASFHDINGAYDLGHRKRPPEYKDWHDWAHKRRKLAGRSNLNAIEELANAVALAPRTFARRTAATCAAGTGHTSLKEIERYREGAPHFSR
jgi:hypothetical protein